MKKLLYLVPIFLLGLLFVQCRDEEKPNRPPSAFELTDDNFKVMYNAQSKTVSMDWPNVSDPDGQNLTYRVAVNGQEKGKDLKESRLELAEGEFADLRASYTFKVTAADPMGLTSSASAERRPFPNEAPNELAEVSAKATFYGAELSWEAATDPDQNKVYYSIEIGGTVVASGIESTSFIVRGYDEETTHKATVKAVDEFGAESQGKTVEFTTLKKETISSKTVTVKVWGIVVNEDGEIIEGATVKVANQEQQTNERGLFVFNEVSISENRGMLTVTAPNYFKSYKTLKVMDGSTSFQRIEMLPKEVIGTINAAQGGEVTSDKGMKIELPEDAFEDYNGEVKVATRLMDPTDEDFGFQNPGLESFNAQGEYGALESFGMAAIEMQNANGEEMQLKSGKQATLTFPVPEELKGHAPEVIPLWSFDEEQNIWVEEGQAELKNGVYVGKVGHFSLWNCDKFRSAREVCFTVVDENGNRITNGYIEIILEDGMVAGGFTDENGVICTFMPVGVNYTINLSSYSPFGFSGGGGGGGRQCSVITGQEGPGVPVGNTRMSHIIKAEGGQELYVSIEGKVEDCEGKLLKNSLVLVRDHQDNAILGGFSDGEGKFQLQGVHCFVQQGNNSNRVEVIAYDIVRNKYSKPREFSVTSNRIIVEEPFKVCEDNIPEFGESGGVEKIHRGRLNIYSDQDAINFALEGYTGVDGSIYISGADVTDISGFGNRLTKVTGSIYIRNTGLKELSDFNKLKYFENYIIIEDNKELARIAGFNALEKMISLQIRRNDALKIISGFSNFQGITETSSISHDPRFEISGHPVLERIEGFENVTSGGRFLIGDNAALTTITGFHKMSTVTQFYFGENRAIVNLDTFENISGEISGSQNSSFQIQACDKLETVPDFDKLEKINGSFLFLRLPKLTKFPNFSNLTTIGGNGNTIRIEKVNIKTIDGFNKLKSIKTNYFKIDNCENLIKISGFNAIEIFEAKARMDISNNPLLEEYCGIPKTVWDPQGSSVIGEFHLSGNKYNPTQAALFDGKCKE